MSVEPLISGRRSSLTASSPLVPGRRGRRRSVSLVDPASMPSGEAHDGRDEAEYTIAPDGEHTGDECLDCRVRTAKEKGDKATLFLFLAGDTPAGRWFEYFTMFLISANVLTFILGTEETIMNDKVEYWFDVLEVITVVIFTVEYIARTWSCLEDPQYQNSYWNYFISFFSIVDLLAIVPFYVDLCLPQDLIPTTMIRIFRLFRLFKAEHYIESFTILDNVYARNAQLLKMCGFVALLLWIMMAIAFHICERHNERMEGAFDTIPNSLYFTAIFFGGEWARMDFTWQGKIVGGFMIVAGIAIYAIPIGLLGEGFEAVASERKEVAEQRAGTKILCASCHKPIKFFPHLKRLEDDDI